MIFKRYEVAEQFVYHTLGSSIEIAYNLTNCI